MGSWKSSKSSKNIGFLRFSSFSKTPGKKPIGYENSQKLAYFEWNKPKLQNRVWSFKKVKFSKWRKFSNNISWVFEICFEPRGMLRKPFGPIWMYIEHFYENEKNRIFSNFRSFSKPYDRLGPEISSRDFRFFKNVKLPSLKSQNTSSFLNWL